MEVFLSDSSCLLFVRLYIQCPAIGVSALTLEFRGSICRPSHTKNYKKLIQRLPALISALRVRLGVRPCDILLSCPRVK